MTRPRSRCASVPYPTEAWSTSVAMTRASSVEGGREERGGEVLVDDGLDPAQPAVAVADHGDAAASGADDDVPGVEEGARGPDVEHLQRLGGGDDPPPALLAPVLPDLAVVDHPPGRLPVQVAAHRLARVGEAGVVAVDEGAGDEGSHRSVGAQRGEGGVECVEDRHPERPLGLGAAPVQRHRRDDVRGELVLDEEVADLGPVPVRDDELVPRGDEPGGVLHRAGDGGDLGARGGVAVGAGHRVAAEGQQDPHLTSLASGPGRCPGLRP